MKRKTVIIELAFTAAAIILFSAVAAAIYNNQPKDSLPGQENSVESSSDTSVLENTPPFTGWIINRMGYSYIYLDRALQQFNGTSKTALLYADTLNSLKQQIEGQRFYSIIVPTQAEYLDIPADVVAQDNFYCTSQTDAIYTSNSALINILSVNITELLAAHSNEYLYFRTDYNWTADAAYYAYIAYCDAAKIKPVSIESYEAIYLDNYLGWFYTATESEILLDNADTIVYYRTEAEYPCYITAEENGRKTHSLKYYGTDISAEKGYGVFIGNEKAYIRFETRSEGGTLLIIGDSSVHAFLPFLMPHYSEITFYNPNCFDPEEEYVLPAADDVLFMSYATNANNASYCEKLEELFENE